MLKISIPTPCQQDWSAMTPNEQGRHCTSCAKTVVDFTSMSDEAIKHFFINKKEEKVCGRFKNEQLQRIVIELPHNIFYLAMPGWKQFLVASLIVFSTTLFSCDTAIKGEVIKEENIETITHKAMGEAVEPKITGDTTSTVPQPICTTALGYTMPQVVVGKIQAPLTIEPTISGGIIINQDNTIMGAPAIIPVSKKMGDIKISEPDSLNTKNLPKADSGNCETKIFY